MCSYRVRGLDGSRAEHLTVESYKVVMLLTRGAPLIGQFADNRYRPIGGQGSLVDGE